MTACILPDLSHWKFWYIKDFCKLNRTVLAPTWHIWNLFKYFAQNPPLLPIFSRGAGRISTNLLVKTHLWKAETLFQKADSHYHNWAWIGLALCKGVQKIGWNPSSTATEKWWKMRILSKSFKNFQIRQMGAKTVQFNLQKSLIYQNFQSEKSGRMHSVKRE